MSYKQEKSGDILIYGYEQGVQPSPHKGLANIQNANISTETGEVMASYARALSTMTKTSSSGTLTFQSSTNVTLQIASTNNKLKGTWITVASSSHTGELPNATYYVLNGSNTSQLSSSFNGSPITGYTSGLTATFTLLRTMGASIAYTVENYFSSGTQYSRYYVLDNQGLVWVYDTINDSSSLTQNWFLPDNDISYWGSDTAPSGLTVIQGTLMVFSGNKVWVKPTVKLGTGYVQMTNATLMSSANSSNPHFATSGHQGRAYYTDGPFLGSIFPDTSLLTGVANIQSYAAYTAVTTTGTISQLYSGTIPGTGAINQSTTGFSGVPVVFFPDVGGTLPAALTANTVYYIAYYPATATFEVYDTLAHANTGGATGRLDIATGASGTQFYNTFWVVGTHAGAYGDTATMTFTPARLNLPTFEVSQCLAEVGNTLLIGTKSSVVYPWNQVDVTPSGLINIPEANTKQILTVNQMAYIFAGYKGNVYITDGSVASLVIKVPDYCAGVPGNTLSYYEPNFTWGGVMYLRGRVYFSILDQTSLKAGNCGGVWSFVPTQNLYIGQDTGIALRLENQNSYGTYSGFATVLIPWVDQSVATSPQYWSGWQNSYTAAASTLFGIDKSDTVCGGTVVVESDAIPVGTVLDKYTPKQLEYKLSSPLTAVETVQAYWRKNLTDSWTSFGTVFQPDGLASLSGYFQSNFQGAQWVQVRLVMTPATDSSSSFTRLTEMRLR